MNYRRIGNTGLKVSTVSLGSWLTYGNAVEAEKAKNTIESAYDLGINFFDTANVYATGKAETIVGEVLGQYRRDSYVLATKAFFPMGKGPNDKGLSRKHLTEQLHASLKRLNTDYVDIFYCHRFDEETPLLETLRTLNDFVRQGKVLYIGVSEWSAAQITEALGISDRYLLDSITVHQPQYNMFHRNIEKETIPLCASKGIGQVVFSPLAQGVLTGKYRTGEQYPTGSRATDPSSNMFMDNLLTDTVLDKVDQLKTIAEDLDIKLSQLALAWVLRNENVASALIGASNADQVKENIEASKIKLDQSHLNIIEEILAEK
ncbi:aldo/keto reductase family protein [Bacillaceae bacterium IKA-2]|nr:aldo/keto reductase family protein [Bacillaceae bacterium IKA-2]